MADDMDWYEVVEGPDLLQGDLLNACPIPEICGLDKWPLYEDEPVPVDFAIYDAVVLSQSCDLVNDKVNEVILAQFLDSRATLRDLVHQGNTFASSRQFREKLVAGDVPSLSLLRKREQEPSLPWSIVDFHRIFVLPKSVVQAVAKKSAKGPIGLDEIFDPTGMSQIAPASAGR